jgi:hypothetical protein
MTMQSSQTAISSASPPGKGTPQRSQTSPAMNGVSRQHSPQSPKSDVTSPPQLMHCGG